MDIRNKKIILSENRKICTYGVFKNVQKNQPIINKYEKIILLEPENIPKVNIIAETQPISIAIQLLNPIIMNTIACDYDNNNKDDIYSFLDISIYLQSNLCVLFDFPDLIPPKFKDSVIYMKNVLFFRNENLQLVNDPRYISIINVCPIKQPELVEGHMKSTDFLITTRIIETFFITAYVLGHKSIILTRFGCNNIDKNPAEDIAFIYNYCIIKYGHLFDNIVITFNISDKDDFPILRTFQRIITNLKFEDIDDDDDDED